MSTEAVFRRGQQRFRAVQLPSTIPNIKLNGQGCSLKMRGLDPNPANIIIQCGAHPKSRPSLAIKP